MPFESDWRVAVEQVDENRWRLLQRIRYDDPAIGTIEVPAGYVTDFASVPRIAVWLIPRFGRYTVAAILHDRLLTDCLGVGMVTARDADRLFREALREVGTPPVRRWLMWTGVRWGALASRTRRAGWLADAPAVLGISTLALPLAVPMLAVAAGLVLYSLAEAVATGGRRRGTLST
jgi:hypothetical protein